MNGFGSDWPEFVFAEPPDGSGLKPVMGNTGSPTFWAT